MAEIEQSLEHGGVFPCHLTIDYDDEEGEPIPDGQREQHCAGALIILTILRRPSQMMRIAQRLRWFDPGGLDLKAPVYRSFAAMRAACRAAQH